MVDFDMIFAKEKVERALIHKDESRCIFPYCNLEHTEYEAIYTLKEIRKIIKKEMK